MHLETKRLLLRDYEPADLKPYFELKSDPKAMYYLQDLRLFTIQQAKEDLERILMDQKGESRKFYFFNMVLKKSGESIGSIGYTVTDNTPVGKLVQAGYFTVPKAWGQGYTTEAFKRVLQFAFSENNVYRVTTGCLKENVGSEKVMQKCGLIKEAEHIDWEWHDGKIKTRLEYRMLRNEWNDFVKA